MSRLLPVLCCGLCALLLAGPAASQEEAPRAPAVDAAPDGAPVAPPTPREGSGQGAPFGFRGLDTRAPLAIHSDELEAVQHDGRRTLVFRRQVRVTQGELEIRCNLLEALYPANSNQPERLVARGDVKLAQGDQSAECDEAVYARAAERLTCSGNARFIEGGNQLAGESIEIDLRAETVTVKGGASVLIQPETLEEAAAP